MQKRNMFLFLDKPSSYSEANDNSKLLINTIYFSEK